MVIESSEIPMRRTDVGAPGMAAEKRSKNNGKKNGPPTDKQSGPKRNIFVPKSFVAPPYIGAKLFSVGW